MPMFLKQFSTSLQAYNWEKSVKGKHIICYYYHIIT